MNQTGQEAPSPEIVPPAVQGVARVRSAERGLFSDANLDGFAHLLDDLFHIPGTPVRVGLDGLIGLIPGLGDVIAGLASSLLIVAAWVRGVPYVTLARMTINLAVGVLIGAIPFLGDAFDILWKPNRRNYRLMVRHLRQPHQHTWRDWAFLGGLLLVVLLILATPVIVLAAIVLWLLHRV